MAQSTSRTNFSDGFLYLAGAFLAFLLIFYLCSSAGTSITNRFSPKFGNSGAKTTVQEIPAANLRYEPPERNFYDDPELSYSKEKPIKDWDEKRKEWLNLHPSFAAGAHDRVVMVTGSQPGPCKSPTGDHFLLRLFKNKVDYCRIHGHDIFYNTVLLHRKMPGFWAKYPAVKAAMVAHPEAEWIWWVDSDAVITDMDFKLPLRRYDSRNLVVHGWPELISKRSWTALNAGVFLIRNCQWSMDFMHKWANMGPIGGDYKKWGEIQRSIFKDKLFPESDDQTALIYMMYMDKGLTDKIYLEREFYLDGYWVEIVPMYDNITRGYTEMEREDGRLRRRHAEKVSAQYGAFWEERLTAAGKGVGDRRRPFVTHFTGCEPCSGDHNKMYGGDRCWDGIVKALNFADNQVLRKYGFVRPDLLDSSLVEETPFDYPYKGN